MSAKDPKKKLTGSFLNDLTHLEINTIIKDGMTSAPAPTEPVEILFMLLGRYKAKLKSILDKTDDYVDDSAVNGQNSFEQFHQFLNKVTTNCDKNGIRLDEQYYILFLRMKSFCHFLDSTVNNKNDTLTVFKLGKESNETLYNLNLDQYQTYSCTIDTDLLVKLKRYYDLGTEEIILQTRIGIGGDIVTRIHRDFANAPRQLLVDIHEKHTTISMDYWKSLIQIAVDIIDGIIKNRKK